VFYISPCVDSGVTEWTPETAARGAIGWAAPRRGVGGVDGLLAGHPAGGRCGAGTPRRTHSSGKV